jgi:hypothetical protein
MRKAGGTSAACTLPLATAGTISFIIAGSSITTISGSSGYVYWPAFLGVAITSMICAPIGAWLASKTNVSILKKIFAVFLLLTSLGLIF